MIISRRHVTLGIVLAAGLLAAVLAGLAALKWNAARGFSDTRIVLSRFPVEDAVVINADFAAVRGAGLLSDSGKLPLEPDYKQFLDGTGFDYRKDLDSVTASFSKSGNFFIARGRFNWAKLRDYAAKQGGSCYQDLCRMPGSTPQRRISFLPLRDDTMALAVSTDDLAANRLTNPGSPITATLPTAPVWMIIPGSALHESAAVPAGLRLMLSALTNADRLVVTLSPSGSNLDAKMLDAKMEATCRSKDEAHVLASQLRSVTAKLKDALQQNKDAQGDELVRVLVGGKFDDHGALVDGTWPFSKSLIASLTAGI
jgi:hypothetical protein